MIRQLFRYTLVGGLAFLLDFAILYYLTEFLAIYYLVSAAAAFIAGLTTNYLLSIHWVFEHRNCGSVRREFIIFAVIGVFGLGMNELCLWFFTERAGLHYLAAKIGAAVMVFLWNFIARKMILFRDPSRI